MKYSLWYKQGIRIEGNGGADYICLSNYNPHEETIHLGVGSCCLVEVNHTVPVSLLTSIIVGVLVENDFSIEKVAKKYIKWNNKEAIERDVAKIRKLQ